MITRLMLLTAILIFFASIVAAMPPHPDLLKKIIDGVVPEPIFISDPAYNDRMGIDQGREESLFKPELGLSNYNFLAIMIGFSDLPGTYPPSFADSVLYGTLTLGMQGPPLHQFYYRASYGNFNIVTVNYLSQTGWQTAPNNCYYYTAQGGSYSYGMGSYPNNSQSLCEDAVDAIDAIVDFSNYDNDGDGFVDGLIIIHSGDAAEVTGDTLDIWSHAWNITPVVRDGVQISNYCMVPVEFGTVGDFTMGVLCHEFGHILGLPDLYDYGYDSYGLGNWSLMAYGGWNGISPSGWSGFSPSFLDAWSRVFLGFVTPINVSSDLINVRIPSVEDSARVYRLWTNGAIGPEYFLVEFRGRTYTDTALAGWGLTIFHVDENQFDNGNPWWPGQPPANHYMVALEQADGYFDLEQNQNSMDFLDPFPIDGFNENFNDSSLVTSRDYYGNPTYVGINNIAQIDQMYGTNADLCVTHSQGGCSYTPGDANGNDIFNGLDVGYSVNYLKGLGPAPPDACDCPPHGALLAAADANGNCAYNGLDVTYSVNYLKGIGSAPQGCADCPPAR